MVRLHFGYFGSRSVQVRSVQAAHHTNQRQQEGWLRLRSATKMPVVGIVTERDEKPQLPSVGVVADRSWIEELPSVISQGKTMSDLKQNLYDALMRMLDDQGTGR